MVRTDQAVNAGMPRLPLGVALAGLVAPASLRGQVEWAAGCGFRAVQLNAAAADSRPRDLGRSARRDIAALLRRHELELAGVDLWLPPAHLIDAAHADRAAEALRGAIDLAAELAPLAGGRAVVSVALPVDARAAGVVGELATLAQERGVALADHAWPGAWGQDAPAAKAADGATPGATQRAPLSAPVLMGLDPAAVLLSGAAPETELARRGAQIAAARLSDLDATGRVEPGTGRLDLLAYAVALAMRPDLGAPVLDLRNVKDQDAVARRMVSMLGASPRG
jgi:sugar phosphate isomerase/epimerase